MADDDTTLRDRLALERTALANERTLLAYGRTALMLVASGATLWRLQPLSMGDRWLGMVAVGVGIAVLALGVRRFFATRRDLGGG